MTILSETLKQKLELKISAKCVDRVDVGLCAFSGTSEHDTSVRDTFSYSDNVAVAALINQGYSSRDAAAYVNGGFVAATPHYAEHATEEDSEHQHEMRVGFVRLADGGIWTVTADLDTRVVTPDHIVGDFFIVAVRGASIVDESPADRARHLLTECDARGLPNGA